MRRKVLDSLAESFSSEPRIFSILVISTDNKDVYCWKLFFKILI
jgi:hypothetical protein